MIHNLCSIFSGTCKFKTTSKVSTFKGINIISDSIETCEAELNKKIASSVAFKETLLKKQGCVKQESRTEESSEDTEEKWVDGKTGAVCAVDIEVSCAEKTDRRKRSSRSANSEYDGELNVTSKKSVAVVEESAEDSSEGDNTDAGNTDTSDENNADDGSDDSNNNNIEDNTEEETEDNTEDKNTSTEEQADQLEDFTVTDIVEAFNAAAKEEEEKEAEDQSEDNSEDQTEENTSYFELVVEEDNIAVENEEVLETTEEVDTENVETVETNVPEEEPEEETTEGEETEDENAEGETTEDVDSNEKIEELENLVQELKTKNEALDNQIELLEENYQKLEGEIEDVSSKQRKSQLVSIMQQSQSSMEIFNLKKQMEEMASQFYNGMAQTLTLFSPTKTA